MKYIAGIIIVLLIAGGTYFGFNMGKNESGNTNTPPASSSDTTLQSNNATPNSATSPNILDLSNKNLTKVTSDIYSKTNTTELILSNNSITTLPSEMGKMTKVTIFKIDHNLLDGSLIGEIRQMSQLKTLDVSYNKMTGMPAEIGQLSKLESLNYSYNDISGLPNELSNLKNNLKEFNLTGNSLTQDQITKLKSDLPNTKIIF